MGVIREVHSKLIHYETTLDDLNISPAMVTMGAEDLVTSAEDLYGDGPKTFILFFLHITSHFTC